MHGSREDRRNTAAHPSVHDNNPSSIRTALTSAPDAALGTRRPRRCARAPARRCRSGAGYHAPAVHRMRLPRRGLARQHLHRSPDPAPRRAPLADGGGGDLAETHHSPRRHGRQCPDPERPADGRRILTTPRGSTRSPRPRPCWARAFRSRRPRGRRCHCGSAPAPRTCTPSPRRRRLRGWCRWDWKSASADAGRASVPGDYGMSAVTTPGRVRLRSPAGRARAPAGERGE